MFVAGVNAGISAKLTGRTGLAMMMNLSEEQCLIRDSVRDFVQDQIAPFAAEWDQSGYFPAQELKLMGELGLFGMAIPETSCQHQKKRVIETLLP